MASYGGYCSLRRLVAQATSTHTTIKNYLSKKDLYYDLRTNYMDETTLHINALRSYLRHISKKNDERAKEDDHPFIRSQFSGPKVNNYMELDLKLGIILVNGALHMLCAQRIMFQARRSYSEEAIPKKHLFLMHHLYSYGFFHAQLGYIYYINKVCLNERYRPENSLPAICNLPVITDFIPVFADYLNKFNQLSAEESWKYKEQACMVITAVIALEEMLQPYNAMFHDLLPLHEVPGMPNPFVTQVIIASEEYCGRVAVSLGPSEVTTFMQLREDDHYRTYNDATYLNSIPLIVQLAKERTTELAARNFYLLVESYFYVHPPLQVKSLYNKSIIINLRANVAIVAKDHEKLEHYHLYTDIPHSNIMTTIIKIEKL